ncbi:uncharacterized protein LOC144145958 [Haemaphysalis longicornis]
MSTKGDTGQKAGRSKEKGKKRAKPSVDSMDASASKPSKHGKKKGGATKKAGDKKRAVSENRSASNKPKSRDDKAAARKGVPSAKKTKPSKSRKHGSKHGGKGSTGKRKSIFRKIYRRLWGTGSKEKKPKKKRSHKGGTKKPSPEEPTSSGQSADKKPQGVVSEAGEPTPKAPEQPTPEQQKAPEQLAPVDKTTHDQKTPEKIETAGGAPVGPSPQDANESVAHAGYVPGDAEKNKGQKTLETEKDGTGKVDDKGVSELHTSEPTTNAPGAEQNGVGPSGTKTGQPEDGAAIKGSPEVTKPAVQEGAADTRGMPTAKIDPQVQSGARPKTGWAVGRPAEDVDRPHEDVIQPERLPVKDDDKVAATGVAFPCSQAGAKHEGAVAVDWASLQDFLLPEFSAVF